STAANRIGIGRTSTTRAEASTPIRRASLQIRMRRGASAPHTPTSRVLKPWIPKSPISASALNTRSIWTSGEWASALIYGANRFQHSDAWSNSLLFESNLAVDAWNSVFGRVEYVAKTAADLDIADRPPEARFDVGSIAFGYIR